MTKRLDVNFLSWRLGKFLQKHNVKYAIRRHFETYYFETFMSARSVLLIRVADHAPNMDHYWQPDVNIYNDKDYRQFKKQIKQAVLKEYGYDT
jgi:hypothetical protein